MTFVKFYIHKFRNDQSFNYKEIALFLSYNAINVNQKLALHYLRKLTKKEEIMKNNSWNKTWKKTNNFRFKFKNDDQKEMLESKYNSFKSYFGQNEILEY